MLKCHCGNEFEDSEFGVLDECEDCRIQTPTFNTDEMLQRLARDMMLQQQQATIQQQAAMWNTGNAIVTGTNINTEGYWYMPMPPRIGNTIRVQQPTRFIIDDDQPF